MSSSVMPERALEDQRLEHRGVEPAVGLGVVGQRRVGDRLVLEREHERLAEVGVDVAEPDRLAVRPGASSAVLVEPLDLEVAPERVGQRLVLVGAEVLGAGGGWGTRSARDPRARPGTSARSGAGPRRRSPRRRRARSRSGGGRRRSAARRRRARRWTAAIAAGVGDPPQPVDRAVVVGRLAPRAVRRSRGSSASVAAPGRIGEQREDRGEVGPGRARQPQPVLLRARVRALVRPDPSRRRTPPRARARGSRGACARLPSGPV